MVVKRDGRREELSRDKLLSGIRKACQKRPISLQAMEQLVDRIFEQLLTRYEHELPAEELGKLVMDGLRELDQVAYVRFASVYRQFKDISHFMKELKDILGKNKKA